MARERAAGCLESQALPAAEGLSAGKHSSLACAARLFIHPTYTAPYRSAAFLIILFEPLEEHPVAGAANNEKGGVARAQGRSRNFANAFGGAPKCAFN